MVSGVVRQIKDRLDIVELIEDYVRLKKSGANFMGLCPFHEEKTPSFSVSPSRQTFHCFGCGQGGDIFTFMMQRESLTFREALEVLAERAGISLATERRSAPRDRSLFDVMEKALSVYRGALHSAGGEMARNYLARRILTPDSWDIFELGWAPSSWNTLSGELDRHGISSKEALDAGLVLEGQKGLYDRFRGRVIFPVRDITGRLLAFGGRLIDGEGAKYINSPEGILYSKRRSLYLLHRAKETARSKNRLIFVEGYMDAIRLHVNGYTETVASLGTSLTEEQAHLAKRLTDNCYICYDSDQAGQEAALRGMYTLQKAGLNVHVITLPEGKDPDDLLTLPDGNVLFSEALKDARPLILHHLYIRKPDLDDSEKRQKATEDILTGLDMLTPVEIAPYLPDVAANLGVFSHELSALLEKRRSPRKDKKDGEREEERGSSEASDSEKDVDPVEAAVCAMLWNEPSIRNTVDGLPLLALLSDRRLKILSSALLSAGSLEHLEEQWLTLGDTFPLRVVSQGGSWSEKLGERDPLARWAMLIGILEEKRDRKRYEEIRLKLSRGEASREELSLFTDLKKKLS